MVRPGLTARKIRARLGAVALAWSLGTGTAQAEPARASLSVARGVGAETCSDTSELEALVRAAAGDEAIVAKGKSPVHVHVRIDRVDAGLRGTIELSGAWSGTRTLDDPGPACDVLSQGLAVTIAVLLDAGEPTPAPGRPPPEPKPPAAKAPATPPPDDGTARPPEEPSSGVPITITVGTYFDFGTADGSAAGLVAAAELVVPIVTFGAAFLTLPHAPRDRGPDHVYRFFAGRARVCTREPYLELFGASVCAGLLAGTRMLDAPRYNMEALGAFVAATFSLEISRRITGPFGAYADLNLSVPAFREDLLLTIAKTKIEPNEEPVTFQMGAGFRFWISK